jgi:hypothetical protein
VPAVRSGEALAEALPEPGHGWSPEEPGEPEEPEEAVMVAARWADGLELVPLGSSAPPNVVVVPRERWRSRTGGTSGITGLRLSGERGGVASAAAIASISAGAARTRGARSRRRSVYLWRRVLVVTLIAVVGGLVWEAAQQLFIAAGSPVAGVTCPGSPNAPQAMALAAAERSPGAAAALGTCPKVYVARAGDTVWGIAVRYSEGGDPRALADSLEDQIGGELLQPGVVLAVP